MYNYIETTSEINLSFTLEPKVHDIVLVNGTRYLVAKYVHNINERGHKVFLILNHDKGISRLESVDNMVLIAKYRGNLNSKTLNKIENVTKGV